MVDSTDDTENNDNIRTVLEKRFDPDEVTLEKVINKIEEAQQMEELANFSHWEDSQKLADGLENFSQGYGLKAGWNTWIGIQKTDTSHLTIDDK